MEERMMELLRKRANDLMKEASVQEKMLSFDSNEEAEKFVIGLAMSTLMSN